MIGNGRGYITAIVTGNVAPKHVREALDAVNILNPHYKKVRAFFVRTAPFSIENGMLTANGKLKRDVIATCLRNEIEEMYAVKQAV